MTDVRSDKDTTDNKHTDRCPSPWDDEAFKKPALPSMRPPHHPTPPRMRGDDLSPVLTTFRKQGGDHSPVLSRRKGSFDGSVGSNGSGVYVRSDGKKVRRVRRRSRSNSRGSYASDSEGSIDSGVYVRSDGKKVRRVKRSKKKKNIPAQVSIQATPPSPIAQDEPDTPKSDATADSMLDALLQARAEKQEKTRDAMKHANALVNMTEEAPVVAPKEDASGGMMDAPEHRDESKEDNAGEMLDDLLKSGDDADQPALGVAEDDEMPYDQLKSEDGTTEKQVRSGQDKDDESVILLEELLKSKSKDSTVEGGENADDESPDDEFLDAILTWGDATRTNHSNDTKDHAALRDTSDKLLTTIDASNESSFNTYTGAKNDPKGEPEEGRPLEASSETGSQLSEAELRMEDAQKALDALAGSRKLAHANVAPKTTVLKVESVKESHVKATTSAEEEKQRKKEGDAELLKAAQKALDSLSGNARLAAAAKKAMEALSLATTEEEPQASEEKVQQATEEKVPQATEEKVPQATEEKVPQATEEKDTTLNPWLIEPEELENEQVIPVDATKVKKAQKVERDNVLDKFGMAQSEKGQSSPTPNLKQEELIEPSENHAVFAVPDPKQETLLGATESKAAPPPAYRPKPEEPTRQSGSHPAEDHQPPPPSSERQVEGVSSVSDRHSPKTGPSKVAREIAEPPAASACFQDPNPLKEHDPKIGFTIDTSSGATASSGLSATATSSGSAGRSVGVDSTGAIKPTTEENVQGGRLWQMASKEGTRSGTPTTSKRGPFPESLMEKTRSRAEPDAPVTPRSPITPSGAPHVVGDDDDDRYILQTAVAKKRTKVVQLLIFGLIGLAFGFLGSFYVQSACHFLTARVAVDEENEENFNLHYGMWRYTPINSAFEGYSYCYKYDGEYTNDPPIFPRIVGLLALVLGVYSLVILWIYLVLGRTTNKNWTRAIYSSIAAGVFQGLTMLFFVGSVCNRNQCSVGPGAVVSIISTVTWFVLAFEMHYNRPVRPGEEEEEVNDADGIMTNLEMSDVERGVTAFFGRMSPRPTGKEDEVPTLNQFQRSKGETPRGGSYVPPIV